MNQKSSMNVGRESDGRVVPAKSLNEDGGSSAEGSEGRRPAKENIAQATTSQTQSWGKVLSPGQPASLPRHITPSNSPITEPCLESSTA
jgi:hypothetical protein